MKINHLYLLSKDMKCTVHHDARVSDVGSSKFNTKEKKGHRRLIIINISRCPVFRKRKLTEQIGTRNELGWRNLGWSCMHFSFPLPSFLCRIACLHFLLEVVRVTKYPNITGAKYRSFSSHS